MGGNRDSEVLGQGRTGLGGQLVKTRKLRPEEGKSSTPRNGPREPRLGRPQEVRVPNQGGELCPLARGKGCHGDRRRSGPRPLTEMVFQSPSRKLRRGVRKLMEAAWIKSRSAAPRRFSASDTLIRVFPENTGSKVRRRRVRRGLC